MMTSSPTPMTETFPALEELVVVLKNHSKIRRKGRASSTKISMPKTISMLKHWVGRYPLSEFKDYLLPALVSMDPFIHAPAGLIKDIVSYAKMIPNENLEEYYRVLGTAMTSKINMTYNALDTYLKNLNITELNSISALDPDFEGKVKDRSLYYNDLEALREYGEGFYFTRLDIRENMLIPLRHKFIWANKDDPSAKDLNLIDKLNIHIQYD